MAQNEALPRASSVQARAVTWLHKTWVEQRWIRKLALWLVIIGLIQLFTSTVGDSYVLIPLSSMVTSFISLAQTSEFWNNIGITGAELGIAFGIATAAGMSLGIALGLSRPAIFNSVEPYLIAYYANPIFVFYPILVTILGLGTWPVIAIGTLASFVSITLNAALGVSTVKPTYIKVGRTLGMRRSAILLKISLPSAVPHLFTGLRFGLMYAFAAIITSEFLLAPRGIGQFVKLKFEYFAATPMYGAIFFIIIAIILLNAALISIENRLYRRQLEAF